MGLLDVLFASSAYVLLMVLRFDAEIPDRYWSEFGGFLVIAAAVHLGCNVAFGLYAEMWRHASINEARRVLAAGLSATVLLVVVMLIERGRTPISVPLIGGLLATACIGILRFQSRLFALRRRSEGDALRVAVVGAGQAAAQIVRNVRREPGSFKPVFVVDDDPRKWGMTLLGVPVLGPVSFLPDLVAGKDLDSVLLAIPSADGALVRRVAEAAEASQLPLKILPGVRQLLGGTVSVRDVRDLEIADLLGRSEIRTDLAQVRNILQGRRVLVTGGGGSIGSEIARQVAEFDPALLVLLDCDETHLHDARAKVDPSVNCRSALANIRDEARIREVFAEVRPEVVFHAAALKHVPVLETHAREAIRTNVVGTDNVVTASVECGVERFVFISTDKAVNPSCVMGATKWFGEQLLMSRALNGGSWCCVRFGNVLGSRGSVLPTFERQIRQGGPVTVTDPNMTRFFMSVQEAVQLVLQASAMGSGKDIFMLEMGEPVAIDDLARRMIRLTGLTPDKDIEIRYTGVRPGEKLAEELHMPSERLTPTPHPSVYQLEPMRVGPEVLDTMLTMLRELMDGDHDTEAARTLMRFAHDRSDARGGIDLRPLGPELADLENLLARVHRRSA